MKLKKREFLIRSIAVAILFITVCVVYTGRLVYLQVSGQDYYTMSRQTDYVTRNVTIKAQRGEIYDRNGKPLVTNQYTYDLQLDYSTMPQDAAGKNEIILTLIRSAKRLGLTENLTAPAQVYIIETDDSTGKLLFAANPDYEGSIKGNRLAKLLSEINVKEDAHTDEETLALMKRYGIVSVDSEGEITENYTPSEAKNLFLYRLDMELSNFSPSEPYTMLKQTTLEYITDCKELLPRGIRVNVNASRKYDYPGYASHILGRIGKIPEGSEEYYTERGYPLNAIVGISGAEAAFEEYLRGRDGIMTVKEDSYGNIVSATITKEPVAGQDVYLTIDIDMQMVAEKALAENIFKIRDEAIASGKPLSGEDASKGALTAVDSDTGEVLAICSYPTFNLATFNRDYAVLREDPDSPMFNRALNGTYAPGSTFKVGVALAALDAGIIESDTIIDAKGQYEFYEGYQPRCWLYLTQGDVHGEINVIEAIQESCNYFFYDVGRELTIEKINEYMKHFGLGQPTGIELYEETGVLAGPDYRNDNGLDKWAPGDTLQASIGQSDNLFTPLQITMYISDILNGGTRYSAHMLYKVCRYGTGEVTYQPEPSPIDAISINEEHLVVVKEGMKNVMDNGSAASVFSGYPVPVGGKTGTAQVSKSKSDNGIITVFAPFEDPEIVVTCIIEQGSGGTDAGYAVRDVFDYYFKQGEWAVGPE
ncbi:MAG: hypothetical protein E7638_02680 [Ruminococcaceae bacterium]|nr:hypothetical protein [Oscillospiraceae bacterium]